MAEQAGQIRVIVYQFGKVASTAVVAAFAERPGVSAIQSHFLGEYHLKKMVDNLVNPTLDGHFQQHAMGQFIENVATTRELNSFRRGLRKPDRLVIVSATRDPFDWNRSRFAQDLDGYLPVLRDFAAEHRIAATDDGDLIRTTLPKLLQAFNRTITTAGGIDNLFKDGELTVEPRHVVAEKLPNIGARRLFFGMMTPFTWFDGHLGRTLGVKLSSFKTVQPGLSWRSLGWAEAFIYRFEQAEAAVPAIARRIGVEGFRLATENVSSGKRHWNDIVAAFDSPAAQRLATKFRRTAYAETFGYSGR